MTVTQLLGLREYVPGLLDALFDPPMQSYWVHLGMTGEHRALVSLLLPLQPACSLNLSPIILFIRQSNSSFFHALRRTHIYLCTVLCTAYPHTNLNPCFLYSLSCASYATIRADRGTCSLKSRWLGHQKFSFADPGRQIDSPSTFTVLWSLRCILHMTEVSL